MSKEIHCQCGKAFAIPDEDVGKPFRCDVCQSPVLSLRETGSTAVMTMPEGETMPRRASQDLGITSTPGGNGSGEEMTAPAALTGEELTALCVSVAQQLQAEVPRDAIVMQLVKKGLERDTAEAMINGVQRARNNVHSEAAHKNMLFGALWFIGGVVVTAVTYSMASGGGRYIIAGGAIVGGLIQFFRGVSQLPRESSS